MADESVDDRLVLNSFLCFLFTKFKQCPLSSIRKVTVDFYARRQDEISVARRQLLDNIDQLKLEKPFQRFSGHNNGPGKFDLEIKDIFNIVTALDERKIIDLLPRYVTDNSDNIPTMPLDEGDMSFLLAKMDKMEAMIQSLQNVVYTLASSARPPVSWQNNSHGPATSVQPASLFSGLHIGAPPEPPGHAGSLLSSSRSYTQSTMSSLQLPRPQQQPGNPVEKPKTGNARQFGNQAVRQSMSRPSLTEAVDYTSSNYGDTDDDGFTKYESPRHSRQRKRSERQGAAAAATAAAAAQAGGNGNGNHSSEGDRSYSYVVSASAPANQHKHKPSHQSRKPLLYGKRTSAAPTDNQAPSLAAARTLKSVYLVDNVHRSFDEEAMANFVQRRLGVRLVSIFGVTPRMTRWQRRHNTVVDHRAFRVCINRADTDRFMDATKWPADITVSRWYTITQRNHKNANVDQHEDVENGHRVDAERAFDDELIATYGARAKKLAEMRKAREVRDKEIEAEAAAAIAAERESLSAAAREQSHVERELQAQSDDNAEIDRCTVFELDETMTSVENEGNTANNNNNGYNP